MKFFVKCSAKKRVPPKLYVCKYTYADTDIYILRRIEYLRNYGRVFQCVHTLALVFAQETDRGTSSWPFMAGFLAGKEITAHDR